MRNRNLALILNHLHQNSPISRAELSSQLGINKASISTIIRELIDRGIVIENGVKSGSQDVGHPSIDLQINPDAGRIIGISIQSTQVTAVITDVSPNILWRKTIDLPKNGGMEMGLLTVKSLIQEVCNLARSQELPILGLGLSIPGMVDIETNRLLAAYELGWQNFDLNSLMEGNEDINFYVGNEAHMSGLGERYFGSLEKSACTLYINWGMDISGAILINENVVPGIMGLAGEVGHISLDPTGELCQCGNRGCWNTLVNFKSLLKYMQPNKEAEKITRQAGCNEASLDNMCINSFVELVRLGDKPTLAALEKSAHWLGIGLASLINLFNPDLIILGGPLSQTFDFVYPTVQAEINQRALTWQSGSCVVQPSRHGQDGCLIGAVATVIWNIFNNPEEPIRKTFRRKIKK